MVLQNQGYTAICRGDYAAAKRLLQESFDLNQEVGQTYGLAVTAQNRGLLLLRQGDVDAALTNMRHALQMLREMGAGCESAETLTFIAWACQETGQAERAARLYGAAEALRARLALVLAIPLRALYEDALARLRRELSADAYAAAWEAGHALSAEQAYADAMDTESCIRHQ